jgi:AcrR family transcriptional regulator
MGPPTATKETVTVGTSAKRPAATRRSNRRVQILRRAAHLFLKRGFEGTSMDDIAGALKITKPALYYYFKSKQHLLAAIIDHAQDILQARLQEVIETSTTDEELLHRALHMHALGITHADDAAYSLLGIEETRYLLPADRRRISRRKKEYIDFIRDTLNRLKAQGKLRHVETTAAAYSLAAIVLWIPKWYKRGGRLSAQEVADEIANLALQLVIGDESRDTGAPAHRGR